MRAVSSDKSALYKSYMKKCGVIPEAFKRLLMMLQFIVFLCLSSSLMAADARSNEPIRVVMSAAFVSESGIEVYDEIFHYLGEKLGREIELVSRLEEHTSELQSPL